MDKKLNKLEKKISECLHTSLELEDLRINIMKGNIGSDQFIAVLSSITSSNDTRVARTLETFLEVANGE